MSTTRIALVVHRYGEDLAGGAEGFARRIAHALAEEAEVTVLTTCAHDYLSWADHYPEGESADGPVRVLRFSVPEPRDLEAFNRLSVRAFAQPDDADLARKWMHAQGPNAPELLAHLETSGSAYDAVIFGPYLYATTTDGILRVADRAILTPSLHDEPPAKLVVHDATFASARVVLFQTPEERAFARRRFDFGESRVLGSPMDPAPPSEPRRFRDAHGVADRYALYVGRLDAGKGVDRLVADHAAYARRVRNPLILVLMGPGEMDLPDAPWLVRTGFVSEEIKHDALAGAAVVINPSRYEALCYGQLEAWIHARPTLANAGSPVLEGQSRRSGGGLWYRDADEYATMLDYLAGNRTVGDALGRQGRRFVATDCTWDDWKARWWEAIALVSGG